MIRPRPFTGRTRVPAAFGAGLFPAPAETPREREFRRQHDFKVAWHRLHGEILTTDQAEARLAAIGRMGYALPGASTREGR